MFDKQVKWSVRSLPKGGPVSQVVKVTADAGRKTFTGRRAIILVHGYNNDEECAARSYTSMIQRLRDVLAAECSGAPPDDIRIAQFYWPGDANIGFLSGASYPLEIQTARISAQRLVDFLAGPTGLGEVLIVGHSLGCRLVLEALSLARARTGPGFPRVRWVLLAAGAVPAEMLVPAGSLNDTLPADRNDVRVRFSPADGVLRSLFPLGQLFAGEPSTEALGLYGNPRSWSGKAVQLHDAGHSDYWGNGEIASDMLRALEVALSHRIPENTIPSYRPAGA